MKKNITDKQLKEFGIVIGLGFPIIIGFFIPIIYGESFRLWTLFIGFPFLFLAFLKSSILFYPYKIWMKLGLILGWINSRIILGIIFFLVLVPISLLMKIFGHDPLRIKRKNNKSYRENKKNHMINLKKIF